MTGYDRGPLMKQELVFERFIAKNMAMKHPLTMRNLRNIQCRNTGRKGSVELCYCRTEVAKNVPAIKKEVMKGFV
jgi:hypothetical protein